MEKTEIQPALSAEEWANPAEVGYFDWDIGIVDVGGFETDRTRLPVQIIALANAALPDSDPRKVTREKIAAVREVLAGLSIDGPWACGEITEAFLIALESYLPPS